MPQLKSADFTNSGTTSAEKSLPLVTKKSNRIRVAYFSQDPPAIDSLSPSFDPDSYSVIVQIFDTLVYMDLDGNFKPGLATHWEKLSATRWRFYLREGVKFHNGEEFNANAVKFTFDYILNPNNNAGNRWIFSSLKRLIFDPAKPFQIDFETYKPDGMFLNRFNMFGSICPPLYIQAKGIEHFRKHPIGTGPFRFSEWSEGSHILLTRNNDYWAQGIPKINEVKFVVIPKSQWIKSFIEDKVDFIPNLSGNQTTQLMRRARGNAKIIKRPVLSSYWVMLRNQGPLASLDFRKALNYAVNKEDLVRFVDFGNAIPMASLGKQGEFGFNPELKPYSYSPHKAKALIDDLGLESPIKLKSLVADIAEPAAKVIQKNLEDVGVELELEVVSRSEWANRVVGYKIQTGKPADFDLVINIVDNPVFNLAFHAGLFLDSNSPWSLLNDKELDIRLQDTLNTADEKEHEKRLQALDRFIHEQAFMLFTTQKIITAAVKKEIDINTFGANGHLDYEVLSNANFVKE
ncbi:ABC transporter substrate-binding protein [Aliikangiella sp. G2MR2-5]|uniref:ABC transporter substrate-binding protein n=1 Tax=Aliikangiella sp. G2MR2-5 TaxID=2788943 RepID=UPI0018A8DCCA